MMEVVSVCFEVCYPQRNALSVKKSKAKQEKSAMRHKTSAIFMKFHEAKDCGILFVFLLRSTHILITKSHSRWPLSQARLFLDVSSPKAEL